MYYEGLSEFIRRFKETAYKNQIEESVYQERKAESEEICVHHSVASVWGRITEDGHTQDRRNCHKNYTGELDQAREHIFSLDHVALGNREQSGKDDVVCLTRILKALKNAERYEKGTAQNGIPGYEKHKSEEYEEIREN